MASEPGGVLVEWAQYGKHAGQRADYGVLACSAGALTQRHFDKIIQQFSPGTASVRRTGQVDSLPWVTFTAARIAKVPYVGVAVQEWPTDPTAVDHFGRSIVDTRFFTVPLDVFLAGFGTYGSFYRAVQHQRPTENGAEERVPAAPDRPAPVVSESTARGVAARLLNGPVVLLPASRNTVEARIAVIDQVASWLPAGARASLTASTWVDRRSSHSLRLVFAQPLRSEDDDVDLDQPVPPAGSTEYRQYLAAYRELLGGDSGVQDRLAADTGHYSFATPDEIVAAVRRPVVDELRRRAASGSFDVPRAVAVLTELPTTVDDDGVILTALLPSLHGADLKVLEKHWVPAVFPAARDAVITAAGTPSSADFVALVDALTAVGELPPLITALLAPGSNGLPDPQRADLAARILTGWSLSAADADSLRGWFNAHPDAALFLVTRQAVWLGKNEPQVSVAALLESLRSVLTGTLGTELHPFRLLAARAGEQLPGLSPASLTQLTRHHTLQDWPAATLLHAAATLRRVTPEVTHAYQIWYRENEQSFDGDRRGLWATEFQYAGIEVPRPKIQYWGRRKEKEPQELTEFVADVLAPSQDPHKGVFNAAITRYFEPRRGDLAVLAGADGRVIVVDARNAGGPSAVRWAVGYPDVARIGLTCLLRSTIAAVPPGRGPCRVAVVPTPAGRVGGYIDGLGLGNVAAVAAVLLTGPATIVGAPANLEQRLALLESVGALLPRGCLASLRMTTGPSTAPHHPFHLQFADPPETPKHGAVLTWADLRKSAQPFLVDARSRLYLQRLMLTRAMHRGTDGLVDCLAADGTALDLDDADDTGSLPDWRRIGLSWPSADGRPQDDAVSDDLREARHRIRWDMFDGDRSLVSTIHTLLGEGTMADFERVREYVVAYQGSRESLLQTLGRSCEKLSGRKGQRDERILQGVAWLLTEFVPLPASSDTPNPQSLAELARWPALSVRLLFQVARTDPPVVSTWVSAISAARGGLPPELTSFGVLIWPNEFPFDERAVRQMVETHRANATSALISLALLNGATHPVVGALVDAAERGGSPVPASLLGISDVVEPRAGVAQ
ncbi:hypothetical protein [Cryptosporangium sp. NPDC051539]|uniref:hypothetical protein n=1 Tax=Cryptosporangium sp. NPDC051539 TaxID=3363962 RepID=UPI0037B9B397